jgi:hypothetical protein
MLDGKILILDDYKTDGYIQNKYIYTHHSQDMLRVWFYLSTSFSHPESIYFGCLIAMYIYIYTYCYLDGSISRWFNPGWMDPWIVG